MLTKGKMINELKKYGIRRADKAGAGEVNLHHLKFAQVIALYYEHCVDNK